MTANQAIIGPDYPYHLTDAFDLGYRAARITELLEDAGPLDVPGMASIAFDRRESFAATLVPYLRDAVPSDAEVQRTVALFDGWDFAQPADSAPAAFYAATWRAVLARTFHDELASLPEEQRDEVLPGGGDRWFAIVGRLLEEPDDAWWDDVSTPVAERRDDILAAALVDASAELRGRLGGDPTSWQWGRLHTLDLRNATFGESGIGPSNGSSTAARSSWAAARTASTRSAGTRRTGMPWTGSRRCAWWSTCPTSMRRAGSA